MSDSHSTKTGQISFKINFEDKCRSATVATQALAVASPTYRVDLTKATQFNPFTDSVDALNTYTKGICGEKQVILDQSAPAYLSVVSSVSDPINSKFSITYTDSKAKDADVDKKKTVGYSVRFKDYKDLVNDHTSTFLFEIICPSKVVSSELKLPTVPSNFYDGADPQPLKIAGPEVTLNPSVCFEVTTYEFHFKDKDVTEVPAFIKLSDDKKKFEVDTNNRTFVGFHEVTVRAISSVSKEKLQEHHFSLTIYDSCNQTTLVAADGSSIGILESKAMASSTVKVKFDAYEDSVSQAYKEADLCGALEYSIVTSAGSTAPSYISVNYEAGEPKFEIVLDTKS